VNFQETPLDDEAENRLLRARLKIKKKWPFIMSSVYGLVPVSTTMIPTSCVTPGLVFGYNPDFIKSLPDEDMVCFVVLHEVFHPKLGYFERIAGMTDPYMLSVANDAHDLVINVMLRDAGWKPVPGALFPKDFGFPEGLTMEEYIDLLLKKFPPPPPIKIPAGGSGGNGKSDKDEPGKGGSGGKPDPNKKDGKDGQEKKQGHHPSQENGVCSGGCANPGDQLQQELEKQFGRSRPDVKAIERKTNHDIQEAMKGPGRGNVPGFMGEWAKRDEEESVIPWQEVLGHIIRDATGRIMSGGDDFSMSRPAKRSHLRRILRPGLIDHQIIPYFVLDTSGSMDVKQMMDGVRETCAILRQLGIDEAYWAEVDAGVALEPQKINLSFFEQEQFEFHGRGGTDFRPAFNAMKKLPQKPDIMFYWTDGDGPAPRSAPYNVEVVWGLIPGRWGGNRKPASWGHLVVISNDPKTRKQIEDANAPNPLVHDDDDEEDEDDDDEDVG
jgi:predicted metal-dependent peptidase